jgi:hypothetical protein
MRHIYSLIIIFIMISLIIIPAFCVAFLDIGFIGNGKAVQNIILHVLDQDPNMPGEERLWNAEDLQLFGIRPLLIYLTSFWFITFISWIIITEFLRIDRPNKAFKFMWIWFLFLATMITLSGFMTYYFLYSQKPVYQFVGGPQITSLVSIVLIISFIIFYFTTLFITSRVTRPVVPLATRLMRT